MTDQVHAKGAGKRCSGIKTELAFGFVGSFSVVDQGGAQVLSQHGDVPDVSQALSRSLFAQMIPTGQEAEFYSFYEISERGTSWLGTFTFGVVNQATGSMRSGMLSVIVFFIVGLLLLPFVDVKKAMREARASS